MSSSRRKLQLIASFGLLVLMAVAGVGCNGFFVDPVLTTIQVGPSGVGILVTHTLQMSALGTYDQGGNPKDITGKVLWTSSDEGIATVSAGGKVTGAAVGTATIMASSGAISGTASITVTLSSASITVTPQSQSVSAGGGVPFCLQAISAPSGTDISTLSSTTWTFVDQNNAAEGGINKTTGASCAGQAFLITASSLSPTPAPVSVKATASAPGTNGTVTSPQVTVNITSP